MIKAVIFDMYETLITLFESPAYFSTQMAVDAKLRSRGYGSKILAELRTQYPNRKILVTIYYSCRSYICCYWNFA